MTFTDESRTRPDHSVIIPVHNGERTLRRALQSVCHEIPDSVEIVIVDDRSTDKTPDIIGELIGEGCSGRLARGRPVSIRSIRVECGLPAAARNAGIAATTGAFVSFVDADDEWLANHWTTLTDCLSADPKLDVVWGLVEPFLADDVHAAHSSSFIHGHSIPTPVVGAALYRRAVFERVGLFDESLRFAEDVDWWLRANEARVGIRLLDVAVLRYHLHDTNMTIDTTSMKRDHLAALARSLRRRRAAGDSTPLRQLSDFLRPAQEQP